MRGNVSMSLFREMLSESNTSSCMRLCVLLIVCTTLGNWTMGTIGVICGKVESAGINLTEVVALISALGMKAGQKAIEKKNNKKNGEQGG